MNQRLQFLGLDWLAGAVDALIDRVEHIGPIEFNEQNRYLPSGVTPRPGPIRFDLFPFWKEPLECFDPMSRVREVNVIKGVQQGYTTLLESILFYYMIFVKTTAAMFLTADKELAAGRMDNNILPMLVESGFSHIIQSADVSNARKTGKTKDYLQWSGGGSLIYNGVQNAAKMRQYSVLLMLKDELDGWKRAIGNDGNSDSLTDARCSAYWSQRKILRGSTPLLEPSMIHEAYLRGDQRKYMVLCKRCGFPQELKMRKPDAETGTERGFRWETKDGTLVMDSVRYSCVECGQDHFEHDKDRLFDDVNGGAHWKPTAEPREPHVRSYSLPGFYSPFGFKPWSKCILEFLDAYDPVTKETLSIDKMQVFYNNVLARPFKQPGSRVRFQAVSSHRRPEYRLGQVPNLFATEAAGSPILFITCLVDVHESDLAVSVIGWCVGSRPFLIEYDRFERENDDEDCSQLDHPVWTRLRELIETRRYVGDDGTAYGVMMTLIDSSFSNDAVVSFCSEYASGVYPIIGRDRPAKHQSIREFAEFRTQGGTVGYRITVDHYKDRMASVLRREWSPELGIQPEHHFNAPVDIPDKALKELTVEYRAEKKDPKGSVSYYWHRPGNAKNELWDLLGYGYACVEICAWNVCIQHFGAETVDWFEFWDFARRDENDGLFCRTRGAK